MGDIGTVLWKEIAEIAGNRRFLRVFALAVALMAILPGLEHGHARGPAAAVLLQLLGLFYAVFAGAIVVAQTAPDLVLHERSGHTLEYLLATRLSDTAIFSGKVLVASAIGYASACLTALLQLVVLALRSGAWSWSYLALPQGRLLVFGGSAALVVYMATIGTFVALRVGDQRAAYMVTMLGVAVLALPFLLHVVHLHFTMAWLTRAVVVLAALAVVLVGVGVRLFTREMLVLYLQD